ncbi:MAG TPA: hypothetical protein VLJ13_00145, partial [Brevundimonas sp.]|nr:hypothetical protein [Brevundimonas sp.]
MRRAHSLPIVVLALTAGTFMAGAASAQTSGLRQLSWPGRAAVPAASAPSNPERGDLRRPNLVIPHGGFAAVQPAADRTPPPSPTPRRTLTPASAWLRPATPPAPPAAEPEAPPLAAVRAAPAPFIAPPEPRLEPRPQPRLAPPPPRQPASAPAPEYLPDQGGRGQPVPAEAISPPPPPVAAPRVDASASTIDPADPMAPRRDAPIFRMQQRNLTQSAPVAAPAAEAEG